MSPGDRSAWHRWATQVVECLNAERGTAKDLAEKLRGDGLKKDETSISRLKAALVRGEFPEQDVWLVSRISHHLGVEPPFHLSGDDFEARVMRAMRRLRSVGYDEKRMEQWVHALEESIEKIELARQRLADAERAEQRAWDRLQGGPPNPAHMDPDERAEYDQRQEEGAVYEPVDQGQEDDDLK